MPYIVTISRTADDYKRPTHSVNNAKAATLDDAKTFAVEAYLENTLEHSPRMKMLAESPISDTVFAALQAAFGELEVDEDADEEAEAAAEEAYEKAQAEARADLHKLISPLFGWFQENEDKVFRGEYVPKTLEVTLEEADVKGKKPPDLEESFESLHYELAKARGE